MELADNFQFSYNISAYSLQHLVEKEALFTLENVFNISAPGQLIGQHWCFQKVAKNMY